MLKAHKMEKKSIGKYVAIAAILLVIIAAIGLSGAYKGLGLSFFGANLLSFTPVSTCGTSITNLQCGNQVAGGVVTGLSQVTYTNDFGSFGSTWILTFVLNGAGQYFFGSSSQQLATAINGSTVANNYNLQLTAVQNSQRLVIPYSFSGQYLYTLKSTPIAFNFGWFSQGAGLLTTCYQTNQSASNPTYTVACAGTYATSDLSNVFNAYQSTCQSNSGKAFLLGSGSLGGINGYQLACYGVSSTSAGQIYAAGSPAISENISVIYQNGTSTHKFYLTAQQPENSYNNEIAAQIYGYTVGGLNTYIGTTSPTLIVTSSSAEFINPQSTATINLLNSLSASCYSSAGLNLAGVAFSNYYNPTVFQNCVNQQNQNISVLLSSPLQPTSPFANIKLLGLVASR